MLMDLLNHIALVIGWIVMACSAALGTAVTVLTLCDLTLRRGENLRVFTQWYYYERSKKKPADADG